MPLTKEQLLIPRYKVIDKYPSMELEPFHFGQIITLQAHKEEDAEGFIHIPIKHIPRSYVWQSFFDLYPNIFKSLPWWSDRKIEDMPEYMRESAGEVHKITWLDDTHFDCNDGYGRWVINEHIMSFYEPATKEEYDAYKKNSEV